MKQREFCCHKSTYVVLFCVFGYWILTGFVLGLRLEHFLISGVFLLLFFSGKSGRKLAVALLPFIAFGVSYDWMRVFPNYMVRSIDVQNLYEAEKTYFGIVADGRLQTFSEYFNVHHCAFADFFSGVFYLCWVPVPIIFGIYLYIKGHRELYIHFALVFLFVNLLGFLGYYIHPAAPPWYVLNYGFEAILDTPGHVAGLGRFDELLGFPVFSLIYGRNSNVFAALPSLHSAYMVVALYYAVKGHSSAWIKVLFTIIMVGIWMTAVYTAHHYIIDVLLGILCALTGIVLFEYVLMKWNRFSLMIKGYVRYIQ